jgi:hypothetical protein
VGRAQRRAGRRQGRGLIVLDDGDDGSKRVGEPGFGIDCQRAVDRDARLVDPAHGQLPRGLLKMELGILFVLRHLFERGVNWRIVERPLHRVARADHGVGRRRLPGLGRN